MNNIQNILKDYGLRFTPNREAILNYIIEKKHAVSNSDVEQTFVDMDRVTIYRTLNTFMKKGLIHEIADGTTATKYAICSEKCSDHQHHDEHVHFRCSKCNKTSCIDTISIPNIELPEGYTFQKSSYIISGICNVCN